MLNSLIELLHCSSINKRRSENRITSNQGQQQLLSPDRSYLSLKHFLFRTSIILATSYKTVLSPVMFDAAQLACHSFFFLNLKFRTILVFFDASAKQDKTVEYHERPTHMAIVGYV